MPHLPVVGYALQVVTSPPPQAGAAPANFRVAVAIQLQVNSPFQHLAINGPDEFSAVTELLRTPGRLFFDPVGSALEKVDP